MLAASHTVLPVLSALDWPVVIADGGRLRGGLSALTSQAGIVVVAHRQHSGSAAAAALGFERLAEITSQLAVRSIPTVVALIGARPYSAEDVSEFVQAETVISLAEDPWAAAMLAGRAGSAVRLRRSPLMRSLSDLSAVVATCLRHNRANGGWQPSAGGRAVDERS